MATAVHSTIARPARRQPWHRYRPEIEATIQRLIDILDAIDGDPDLEPSLGALENHPEPYHSAFDLDCDRHVWAGGSTDDREDDAGDNPEEPGALIYWGEAQPDVIRVRRARR